ncbi:hypothetical protein ACFLYO_11465, partial [Chloroflexota bacterium]
MVKQASTNQGFNKWLPILGIILAVVFGALAYALLNPIMELLEENDIANSAFLIKTFGSSADMVTRLMVWGLVFFMTFGTAMFLVSLLGGRSFDEDANIKYLKASAQRKEREKRER